MSEYNRLKKRVEDQQKFQDQERERKKKKPNELMEEEANLYLNEFAFWCETCEEDFSSPCYKTRHRLYGDTIAVWRAKCPTCGTDCIRHITHKDEDLYYQRSVKVRRQRNQYAWETLQADEHGFRTWHGDPYREYNEEMQRREQKIIDEEKASGLKGMSLKTKQRLARLAQL